MDASAALGAALGPGAPWRPEDGLGTGNPFVAEPVEAVKGGRGGRGLNTKHTAEIELLVNALIQFAFLTG